MDGSLYSKREEYREKMERRKEEEEAARLNESSYFI
jgi:hypothetical protein